MVTRLARVGVVTTNRALSSLEHGAGLDVAKLPELAHVLDCTVTYLVGLTDDPHSWEPDPDVAVLHPQESPHAHPNRAPHSHPHTGPHTHPDVNDRLAARVRGARRASSALTSRSGAAGSVDRRAGYIARIFR